LALAVGNATKFARRRVSHTARCESFWVRAGFRSLYQKSQVWAAGEVTERATRVTGDDRRRFIRYGLKLKPEPGPPSALYAREIKKEGQKKRK
jgi:hypothetical protein